MPYLTIKHETRVPSRSFRGKRNPVLAYQGRSRRASNKMSWNVWACLGMLPASCLAVHPLANRLEHQSTSRHHPQEPGTPWIWYAKSRSRTEPAGMVQRSPTIRSHQEPQPMDSCKALWGTVRRCIQLSPNYQKTLSSGQSCKAVARSPTIWLEQLTGAENTGHPAVTKTARKMVLPSFL